MRYPSQRALVTFALLVSLLTALGMGCWSAPASGPSWREHLRRVDEALASRDVEAAEHAWRGAYGAARGARSWEAMVEIGQAARRLGDLTGSEQGRMRARRAFLSALVHARSRGSVDGVLRVADAFADLGDVEVAEQLRASQRTLEVAPAHPMVSPR
jgi:hypothetical protein